MVPVSGPNRGYHIKDPFVDDARLRLASVNGSYRLPTSVKFAGGPEFDSFGRLRVSEPVTLFDSKQIFDNQPLFWDDQEVSGGGTSSVHDADKASTVMSVSDSTAGKRVRQSYMCFNYQPGKSLLVLMTGRMTVAPVSGITAGMMYGDEVNGVGMVVVDGTIYARKVSNATGTPVNTDVAQSSWNGDKLDGTGGSGYTLDPAKTQILWCDFEWLGVGSVRMGFIIDGQFIVAHTFHHANQLTSVYMSSANLPIRYWIENDGTGPVSGIEHICSTVILEGGEEKLGVLRYTSTVENAHVDANVVGTIYAALGIRLKSTAAGAVIDFAGIDFQELQGNKAFEWCVWKDPTVAGTFTYNDVTNSSVQVAYGATANTISGGFVVAGGFLNSGTKGGASGESLSNAIKLGRAIDGTVDEFVIGVRPTSGTNQDIHVGLNWRELT